MRITSQIIALSWLCITSATPAENTTKFEFFEARIRPILTDHCYECHSVESEKIKGGLLLDSREGILKGGDSGTVLVPGDPAKSKLIIAVHKTDKDLKMPPKEDLTPQQIADLEQWVKDGAPDPRQSNGNYRQAKSLWSTHPLAIVEPPAVHDKSWVRDPIDNFVLAAMEKHQLHPVPPAGKKDLIRRATFDLTGLPPTPAEVEDFLQDHSEAAFTKVIDRLLRSAQFGERWGRHWLDLARYADSSGSDLNIPLTEAWRYRDWVVKAWNDDMPYDEFIREQIAGDLLPARDAEERKQKWIATGFLVLGPKNFNEPNPEKLLMDVADEQIDVTSKSFLGLTVSCARCHDHKFDPIPTRDYYAMAGIFRSTLTVNRTAGSGAQFFSERPLGTASEIERFEAYTRKLNELQNSVQSAQQMARDLPGGIDSKELDGIVMDNLQAEVVGNWSLSNYSTNFVDKNYLHDGNDKRGKGKKLVRFHPEIPQDGAYEIRLAYTARLNRATNVPVRVTGKDGSRTVYLNQRVEPRFDKAFESLGVFELSHGTNNLVEILTEGTKGFVVVDAVQFLPKDVQLAASLMKKRSVQEPSMMMARVPAAELQNLNEELNELRGNAPPPMPMALAVRDSEVRNVKIHIRGDPENLGDEVPRGFLTVLKTAEVSAPRISPTNSGRLELAEWIANEKNPLTARVMVNRIWQHLFGRGIVATPDNFGSLGQQPSHPELLDYLAAEFMKEGWSSKKLIKRLMLTHTYQIGSSFDNANYAKDPGAIYLWRMERKRLDAESLRDAILAVSGALDKTMGGSLLPAQQPRNGPPGNISVTNLMGSNRRSLYLPVQRGQLNDLFQVFDFPDASAPAGRRYVTTAPTQALYLMNSPFVLERSRDWAENLLQRTDASDADLVKTVYLTAYSRLPADSELASALEFVHGFDTLLAQMAPNATERKLKAWQGFCQAIIESAEFRYLN
jgi:hypothetical protein